MPAGRMKQFEDPEQSLKREMIEETGITEIEIIKPLRVFHFFRKELIAEDEIVGIIFYCKTEQDTITISSEHDEHQWVDPNEALEMVNHPGVKRDVEAFLTSKSN